MKVICRVRNRDSQTPCSTRKLSREDTLQHIKFKVSAESGGGDVSLWVDKCVIKLGSLRS